eukprot:TRINITY_DN14050_c0_g1_i1.p1 TRINITY_DN14050_c0_g1~~TRINITY_DN14050_c0_g1_i1.p1  ORF type:complete len:444 (+),score=57.63 TRINITY_DN14050_c0_g1_i1:96-1427(+)
MDIVNNLNVTLHVWSPAENLFLAIIVHISAGLSALGSLFLIVCFFAWPDLREKDGYRLIFFLAVADFGGALGHLFTLHPVEDWIASPFYTSCTVQAAFIGTFVPIANMWVAAIAVTTYQLVVRHSHDVRRYEKLWHILSWGLFGVVGLLPFTTRSYGFPYAHWCWLTEDTIGLAWRSVQIYCTIPVLFVLVFVMYGLTIREVRRSATQLSGGGPRVAMKARSMVRRLMFYPITLVLVYASPIANGIALQFFPDRPQFWLLCLTAAFTPSMGILNAFAYGYNPALMKHLRQKFGGSRFCCCEDPQSRKTRKLAYMTSMSVRLLDQPAAEQRQFQALQAKVMRYWSNQVEADPTDSSDSELGRSLDTIVAIPDLEPRGTRSVQYAPPTTNSRTSEDSRRVHTVSFTTDSESPDNVVRQAALPVPKSQLPRKRLQFADDSLDDMED